MVESVNANEASVSRTAYYNLSNLLTDPKNIILPWVGARLFSMAVSGAAALLGFRGLTFLSQTPKIRAAIGSLTAMGTEALGFELSHRIIQDLTTRKELTGMPERLLKVQE